MKKRRPLEVKGPSQSSDPQPSALPRASGLPDSTLNTSKPLTEGRANRGAEERWVKESDAWGEKVGVYCFPHAEANADPWCSGDVGLCSLATVGEG